MLQLAEEMQDGQYERVDIPAHIRTADKGFLQKKNWKRISAESSVMSPQRPTGQRTELTELNCTVNVSIALIEKCQLNMCLSFAGKTWQMLRKLNIKLEKKKNTRNKIEELF